MHKYDRSESFCASMSTDSRARSSSNHRKVRSSKGKQDLYYFTYRSLLLLFLLSLLLHFSLFFCTFCTFNILKKNAESSNNFECSTSILLLLIICLCLCSYVFLSDVLFSFCTKYKCVQHMYILTHTKIWLYLLVFLLLSLLMSTFWFFRFFF